MGEIECSQSISYAKRPNRSILSSIWVMTSHSVLAQLLAYLIAVVVVPCLAASEIANLPPPPRPRAECEKSCGAVEIPFPFGMGPDHCWLPGFEISCKDTGNGVLRPFMVTIDEDTKAKEAIVEVLSISLEQGEAKVLNNISSYCYDAVTREMMENVWNWGLATYSFSSTANKFTVVGCRALAYIGDPRGGNASRYQTGCVSTCFDGKMSLNPCSGMGCCQTTIPKGLKYYQVWFDEGFMNISGIDGGADLFGRCSFAVLMDSSSFPSSSTSSSNNISSPEISSLAFNSSRGGLAPVVLDWSIGEDDCSMAIRSPGYACVSGNSSCSNADSGGYICQCKPGFYGNPYLRNNDGCQDIDECLQKEKYHCFGECANKIGSFACHCPSGTRGNASIPEGCQKDPFPREARIATGILVGVFVALVAFLATELFRNKSNKKRQGYFEQHGGQMLLQILETDGNSTFKLYDRGHIEKATNGFHKANILGEGSHGTVYKAILATSTVAVKRCKEIGKSRTDEFVRELVVLCRVSHPNIVRLLGCCLYFEAPMLVYEFVPNGTLSGLLHGGRRRPVKLSTRLRIAAETAEALAHLHMPPHPTLHGDVKPDNILLGDRWEAKVSDFGCSTINDNVQVVPKGTMAYLDPEFLQDNQITEKTDVYSFGVVLIELLTGKKPQRGNLIRMFQNCMANGTLGDILDADIVEEGSVGLIYAAARLVSQCIVVPGKARPAMAQVAEELRRFSNEMPESHEARVALEFEAHRYSYTTTESETTGFSSLTALSTELAR